MDEIEVYEKGYKRDKHNATNNIKGAIIDDNFPCVRIRRHVFLM
jgi:hypothetical protein